MVNPLRKLIRHSLFLFLGTNPSTPKDFRPISLCNLLEIIDEEQSAFIQGRLITDNALISMECFHWIKTKTKGKKGTMAFKLDMSIAYDRIEWCFVQQVLSSMGFPERGLRQGGPLSPYLFILCANVLSGLIHFEVNKGDIHGIKIARAAPQISCLLFADDNLLFR